jgi:hypothetical protein
VVLLSLTGYVSLIFGDRTLQSTFHLPWSYHTGEQNGAFSDSIGTLRKGVISLSRLVGELLRGSTAAIRKPFCTVDCRLEPASEHFEMEWNKPACPAHVAQLPLTVELNTPQKVAIWRRDYES